MFAGKDPSRVGLVLSGGAARGFAHVGVIEVLERNGIQIDVVTGTSMGSIIGGLYAIGYSPARLRDVTSSLDWERVLRDDPERRNLTIERKWEEGRLLYSLPMRGIVPELPSSLIEGQRISQALTGLTWAVHAESDFTAFPRPFGAVATSLETGEAVPLRSGFLPLAIRASLSIPAAFAPVEIDGRLLIDGGLSRNLPAQDARDLGADWLICSDVSEPLSPQDSLRNLAEILNQTIAYRMWESTEVQRRLCDVLIVTDVPSSLSIGFDRSEEIIEFGIRAAVAALDSLQRIGLPVAPETAFRDRKIASLDPLARPVRIATIRVAGLEQVDRATVNRTLQIAPGDVVSAAEMDRGISRLYDTRLFQTVWYRLTPTGGETGEPAIMDLRVEVRERHRNSLGISYRYDSRYKASLLLSAGFRNLVFPGSFSRGEVRLGEQTRFAGEFGKRWGWSAAPLAALRFVNTRMPFDIYEMEREVAAPNVSSTVFEGVAGFGFGYSAFVGLEGGFQSLSIDENLDDRDWLAGDESFWTVAGVVDVDRWDRARFPRGGWALRAEALWTAGISGDRDFAQQVIDAEGVLPLSPRIGLLARVTAGGTRGDTIPLNYLFFAGGAQQFDLYRRRQFPFYGLRVNERRGRFVRSGTVGIQWEFLSDLFVQLRGNVAALPRDSEWRSEDFFGGWGLTLGGWTRFGSGMLTIAGAGFSELPRVDIDVGFPF
ncbi:MAG: patatin-like phospholipase family protein [Gemmatimonadota bacterium]